MEDVQHFQLFLVSTWLFIAPSRQERFFCRPESRLQRVYSHHYGRVYLWLVPQVKGDNTGTGGFAFLRRPFPAFDIYVLLSSLSQKPLSNRHLGKLYFKRTILQFYIFKFRDYCFAWETVVSCLCLRKIVKWAPYRHEGSKNWILSSVVERILTCSLPR